ncbi:MAG: sensor histidine kinase [Ekhidna sp.]|nr:sensor histidine kinase [Ekhidna sp.]
MRKEILIVGLVLLSLNLTGQELFLDSLLTKPLEKSSFDKNQWYWTELELDTSEQFLSVSNWGHVILYTNGIRKYSGTMVPQSQKTYSSFKNILPISGGRVLLKLKGDHPLFDIDSSTIEVLSPADWRIMERQRLVAHGLFFGILIVMALYNLMIYFAVKDQSYLWYVLSIVGFGLYMGFYYGFALEYVWPEMPHWNATFFALIIPLTNLARIQFAKTYLHTKEYAPRWDYFFQIMSFLYAIPIIMWFISWASIADWLAATNVVIGILGSINMTIITLVSIQVLMRGYRPALWFLVAIALFNIGAILFIYREFNYLPDNFFTQYIIQVGAVAQVVLFSFGLSSRLNRTRKMLAKQTIEKEKLALEKETEKKQLIEKQKNELEVLVKERTHELEAAMDQLRSSESELRELNEVKSKLFSIVSHELKSPLTTVDSYLNLLINHSSKLSQEKLSELSDKTKLSLQNLTRLMDNLLIWSQMQQSNLIFQPVKIDFRKSIDKSIKLFQPLLDQKSIKIELDNQIDEIYLYGDKEMFAFVMRNLIHNSIKFTPKEGKIRVGVDLNEEEANIYVVDSGIGMPASLINQLLDKGISSTRYGTEHEKGSGIGLLLCKDFVEKNGGRMKIKSNKGTEVSFTIPLFITEEVDQIV